MDAKQNGTGFSEENQPFEAQSPATTSRRITLNRDNPFNLDARGLAEVGVLGAQYEAYYAVYALWLRRQAEGMSKKDLADKLERDPAWVTRALAGPNNWTLRTLGELARALGAVVDIKVTAVEDLSELEVNSGSKSGDRPEEVKREDT